PVQSVEDFQSRLSEIKKKYHDARHHCYAYILGEEGTDVRANDDGEPGNSAGAPILGQLRAEQVTNAAIVVVRYFGGTKLGVGGLIQAYKVAAGEALKNNTVIRVDILTYFTLDYAYEYTNIVLRLLSACKVVIKDQLYGDRCQAKVGVKESMKGHFVERLEETVKSGIEIMYKELNELKVQ
ncbi:MAG: YigZ family protein, partial [Cyclobacteriaceae bacterium]|nr:YigZ family protein [Cyclobacteriaceae bacterium]